MAKVKFTADRLQVVVELLVAETIYFKSFGWIAMAPIVTGSYCYWRPYLLERSFRW